MAGEAAVLPRATTKAIRPSPPAGVKVVPVKVRPSVVV